MVELSLTEKRGGRKLEDWVEPERFAGFGFWFSGRGAPTTKDRPEALEFSTKPQPMIVKEASRVLFNPPNHNHLFTTHRLRRQFSFCGN